MVLSDGVIANRLMDVPGLFWTHPDRAVELLPWIPGWGRHCRVLAPKELAELVAKEHRDAAEEYDLPWEAHRE